MEMQSQEIGKLAEALAKSQMQIKGAKEDSKNPFFKSDYADLTSVWKACKSALTENGIAVCQTMDVDNDKIILITTLLHSSGQWIKSRLPVILTKNDPQTLGSSLTYSRRYALAAIAGVCPIGEDDDAEEAMTTSREEAKTKTKSVESKKDKKEQLAYLIHEFNDPQRISMLESHFRVTSLLNLEGKELDKAIFNLTQKLEERNNGKARVA